MRWRKLSPKLFFLLIPALPLWALASEEVRFYKRAKEGWFWYQERPIPEKKQEFPSPPLPAVGSESGPAPFSAAWLKKNLPRFREMAIDDPRPENVAAYFALQRLAIDKAERFARTAELLPVLYPVLDENLRRPLATFAANISDRQAGEAMEEALVRVGQMAGIFFFFKSDCPHCHAQADVLKTLEKYGFHIFPISVDGLPMTTGAYSDFRIDQGQAEALGVTVTPALFLVNPEARGERIRLIGQGAMSLAEIKQRIIDVAFHAGWIDRESYERTLPSKPIYLEPIPGKDLTPEGVLEALGVRPVPKEIPF